MVIRRLEKPSVEELIDRGGDVLADKMSEKKEWVNFTLRIRKDIVKKIDIALEDRIGISKTAWILEAIQEKLKKK